MVKTIREPTDPRFVKTVPPNLTGTCSACRREVETEGNERTDDAGVRWHSVFDQGQGRSVEGWEVRCPTPDCSGWILVF